MSADPAFEAPIAAPADGAALDAPGVSAPTLSGAGRRFLSDILVELGFVDAATADAAVAAARNPGSTPEKVLLDGGSITEDQLARALAERYGLEHIDLDEFPVDDSAAGVLREAAARRYQAAPVGFAPDGALVLAVADPADSLGLSDIAVMTKLAVRPAVSARSQIAKLLDTLVFMQEPLHAPGEAVSTMLVPPDEVDDPPAADTAGTAEHPGGATDEATERELARLREELAMALVARDAAAERSREETAGPLREEHERALAALEADAEEKLRAERSSAQHALAAVRAKHEEAMESERAKRVAEVEAERERTTTAIEAERERNAKELEAVRARYEAALSAEPARLAELERELAAAREQLELTADADRRAEAARAALAALRDESERQAQVHALTERELRAELDAVRAELPEASKQ